MKKIALLFIFFIFWPNIVLASEISLEDLKIKNGELSPVFNSLNNEYTVTLAKEEYNIEMEYKVVEGITVSILDNFDLANNSKVTLLLTDEKEKTEYHLYILKEEEEQVIQTFKEETNTKEGNVMYQYKIFIIPAVCFLAILITFKCLFPKKNKK